MKQRERKRKEEKEEKKNEENKVFHICAWGGKVGWLNEKWGKKWKLKFFCNIKVL